MALPSTCVFRDPDTMWFSSRFRHEGRRAGKPTPEPAAESLHPSRAENLGDEVEAVVAGRLVEHLVAERRAVPPWAALNRMAHGDLEQLRAVLTEPDDAGAPSGDWVRPWVVSERVLTFRLLCAAHDADELRVLQQMVLVPFEWSLIERYKTAPITVRDVFQAATEALTRHSTEH